MNADGSDKHQVTHNGAANFAPYWLPDGKRIIFASNWATRKIPPVSTSTSSTKTAPAKNASPTIPASTPSRCFPPTANAWSGPPTATAASPTKRIFLSPIGSNNELSRSGAKRKKSAPRKRGARDGRLKLFRLCS